MEYILCAAIHYQDGEKYVHQPKNIESGIVVAGRRHHNCFTTMAQFITDRTKKKVQGFITSTDRFVDRAEAYTIAKAAGQILMNENRNTQILISEDLY